MMMFGGETNTHKYQEETFDDDLESRLKDIFETEVTPTEKLDNTKTVEKTNEDIVVESTSNIKEEIIGEILENAEDITNNLKNLDVNEQLQIILKMMGDELQKDEQLLEKIRQEYCYATTVVYKIMTLLGFSKEKASTFSKWYINNVFIAKNNIAWSTITSTFEFMWNWKGLLVVTISQVWFYMWVKGGGIGRYMIPWMKDAQDFINFVEAGQTFFGGLGITALHYLNKLLPEKWAIETVIDYLKASQNMVFDAKKYIYTGLTRDTLFVVWWMMIPFLGIAVFMWIIYVFYGLTSSVDEIENFCASQN